MEENIKPYVILKDEDIIFKGDTPEEQELNKWLYHTTLELNRYQDMTKEILDYITTNENNPELQRVYQIIKDWDC